MGGADSQNLGGAALYLGGQRAFAAAMDKFPTKEFMKRSVGINLTPAQLEERRAGIEAWLAAVLLAGAAGAGGGAGGEEPRTVAPPVKALLWDCLRLDARVTHL